MRTWPPRIGLTVPNGAVVYGQHPGQAGCHLREHELRDALARQLGGITEGKLPYGRADVVTETTVFEVEPVRSWRKGAAQALQYAAQTGCDPALALFGRTRPEGVLEIYLRLRDGRPPVQLWTWDSHRWERITSRKACRALWD